ncbi:MAG: RNA polymerase-binding protein DksA [Zetaproteobacteria bacterium]|nr:MAG: RNA polymerase-binding protein DksA [Zetaproteobacteria bacterium]
MALTKKQIADFEKQLSDWKAELEESQNESVHQMHGQETTAFPDVADQAAAETDLSFDIRIKSRELKLIHKIGETLHRLREGDFGVCDGCSGDIGIKRLQARPVTTLCIDCKNEQEQAEKTRID